MRRTLRVGSLPLHPLGYFLQTTRLTPDPPWKPAALVVHTGLVIGLNPPVAQVTYVTSFDTVEHCPTRFYDRYSPLWHDHLDIQTPIQTDIHL